MLTVDQVTAPGLAANLGLDQTSADLWTLQSGSDGDGSGEFSIAGSTGTSPGIIVSPTRFLELQMNSVNGSTSLVEGDYRGAPALSIYNQTIAYGVVGTAYSAQLSASGGTGTGYTWSAPVSELSSVGLTLSPEGLISGTPTVADQESEVDIQVMVSAGNVASTQFNLFVGTPSTGPLAITITAIPAATSGQQSTATFTVSGGTGILPYYWSITSGAAALNSIGLTFAFDGGLLGGTPNAIGSYPFTVQVTDAYTNVSASASYVLVVGK